MNKTYIVKANFINGVHNIGVCPTYELAKKLADKTDFDYLSKHFPYYDFAKDIELFCKHYSESERVKTLTSVYGSNLHNWFRIITNNYIKENNICSKIEEIDLITNDTDIYLNGIKY